MKPTPIQISDTRYPSLTQAVITQLGSGEDALHSLKDIALHGADGGFTGFTYTEECVTFFNENRQDILHLAENMADELGQNLLDMIQDFKCIGPAYSTSEIGKALWDKSDDDKNATRTIQNGMAWFAAEEIARELNPDL